MRNREDTNASTYYMCCRGPLKKERHNEDTGKNTNTGQKQLLSLCKDMYLFIANGRTESDPLGEFTTNWGLKTNQTVLDYALVDWHTVLIDRVVDFQVLNDAKYITKCSDYPIKTTVEWKGENSIIDDPLQFMPNVIEEIKRLTLQPSNEHPALNYWKKRIDKKVSEIELIEDKTRKGNVEQDKNLKHCTERCQSLYNILNTISVNNEGHVGVFGMRTIIIKCLDEIDIILRSVQLEYIKGKSNVLTRNINETRGNVKDIQMRVDDLKKGHAATGIEMNPNILHKMVQVNKKIEKLYEKVDILI